MQGIHPHAEVRLKTRRAGGRGGFTIVEILVVVVIIAALAALFGSRVLGRVDTAKRKIAVAKLSQIGGAIDTFRLDHERYPETLDELVHRPADIDEDKWDRYLKSKDLLDPWNRPFGYKFPGDHDEEYDLWSLGADGEPGGEKDGADVVNWEQ